MSERKRVVSASARSRYGTPSSRAFGRIESSTSVMLRTMRTVVPEILEAAGQQVVGEVGGGVAEVRGVVRSDAADVHAHHLARLEGHHGPAGRVVEPQRHRSRPQTPVRRRLDPALVAQVDGQQHRGEGLHADRVRKRSAVERTQLRDAPRDVHESAAGVVVVTQHHDVALHVVIELHELRRRYEMEGGADTRLPQERLQLGGDRPVRAAARH